MPVRILQISSAKTYGGGERHFVDLCRGLHDRGHEVFAALRPTNEWEKRLAFLPPENLFHVSIRNSFGVLSAIRISEFARDNKIDVVHAHVARDYIPASIACLAAKGSKFVLTRHVLFPLKPFNRFALKNLSKAIAVSDTVGDGLRKIFPAGKVEVIYNGIDLAALDAESPASSTDGFRTLHGITPDAPLVGTLGELKELKGQREFILAAQEVLKEIPDCRFVVVGKDHSMDRAYRRDLKRLVKVLGMEESFLWLDWLDDTGGFYSEIDVFVSPSRSESFGLAILEAMLHGKAIVATDTDGARELFGTVGGRVPVNDPVAMSQRMVELLRGAESRLDLGSSLKKRAGENFSLRRMLDAVEDVYLSL
ncbi:MAG: glycosyltransferase family 4 protein [Acidobacteriota bacterium]